MKKVISVMILLAFFGSMIVMTGCFGGDDGIGAVLGVAVFVLAISASGGSGAAVFAANQKASIRPAINLSAPANDIKMVVTPLDAQGNPVTASAKTIANTDITASGANFKCNVELPTTDGYNQYMIEVKSGNNTMVKAIKYIHTAQKNGAQIGADVSVDTTAKALTYEKWRQNAATANATSYTYADFEANFATSNQTNFNTLKTNIDNSLNTNTINTDLSTVAGIDASAQSVSTTVPGQVIVVRQWGANAPTVMRGHEIYFEQNNWGPAISNLIGLSFISYQINTTYSYRLANYFHFYPENNQTNNTQVIAYAGNGINLDQANTLPAVWYTNSFQAKGEEMAAGDVYYFRIQKEAGVFLYGAIKIDSIDAQQDGMATLSFHYKYNRTPGSTNLTIQ